MRYICFIRDTEVVAHEATTMSDLEAIALDTMLRSVGKLGEDEEVAIVEW